MLYIYLARICLFPMFCKCREFSKWIRDLCVLPERLASAHVYRKTAGHGEARARAPRPLDPPGCAVAAWCVWRVACPCVHSDLSVRLITLKDKVPITVGLRWVADCHTDQTLCSRRAVCNMTCLKDVHARTLLPLRLE